MGVNTNVFVVKKVSEESDLIAYLSKVTLEYKNSEFEFILGELWERKVETLIAVSQIDQFWFIIDDSHHFEEKLITYSKEFKTELLQAENSDTVMISSFSFYKDGVLIRKLTLGMEEWIDELDGMEDMDNSDIESIKESAEEIGEELEIERNGSDAFSVLKSYAIDFYDFYNLNWNLYHIED